MKKTWETPAVKELEVKDTMSGIVQLPLEILGIQGPS
jgi:hypothetical protein